MSLNRRSLMQMLGIAPIVGPTSLASLSKVVEENGLWMKASQALTLTQSDAPSPVQGDSLGRQLLGSMYEQVEEMFSDVRTDRHKREEFRAITQGFDPDIACLRSVSMVNKIRMQREREYAEEKLIQRVGKLLYGKSYY